MPRKKNAAAQRSVATPREESAAILDQSTTSMLETEAQPGTTRENDEVAPEVTSNRTRNFNHINVVNAGIHYGEDRQFKQVYIKYDGEHRPTDDRKTKMREAGFRYRPNEQRWDTRASAATRLAGQRLVAEFSGITLGAGSSR